MIKFLIGNCEVAITSSPLLYYAGVITYFVPCVTFGQNAEKAGVTSCFVGAIMLLLPLINIICMFKVRGAIRDQNHIEVRTRKTFYKLVYSN